MYIEGVWLAFIDFPSNWTPINVYISRIYNMPWHEAWWRNNFQLFEWLAIDIRLRSVFPPFFFFFWFDKFDISILPGFQFNAFCGGTLWSGGATFLALSFIANCQWMNPFFLLEVQTHHKTSSKGWQIITSSTEAGNEFLNENSG